MPAEAGIHVFHSRSLARRGYRLSPAWRGREAVVSTVGTVGIRRSAKTIASRWHPPTRHGRACSGHLQRHKSELFMPSWVPDTSPW